MLDPRGFARAVCLAAAAVLAPSAASAQNAPYDPAIDVQMFEFAVGPKKLVTVSDADVAAPKQLAFDALFTFLTRPFTVYNLDENKMIAGERVRVVESLAAAQLTAAYGVTDRIQVGVNLPIVFALRGEGLDA